MITFRNNSSKNYKYFAIIYFIKNDCNFACLDNFEGFYFSHNFLNSINIYFLADLKYTGVPASLLTWQIAWHCSI